MKSAVNLILFLLFCVNNVTFAQDKQSRISYFTSTNIDKYSHEDIKGIYNH